MTRQTRALRAKGPPCPGREYQNSNRLGGGNPTDSDCGRPLRAKGPPCPGREYQDSNRLGGGNPTDSDCGRRPGTARLFSIRTTHSRLENDWKARLVRLPTSTAHQRLLPGHTCRTTTEPSALVQVDLGHRSIWARPPKFQHSRRRTWRLKSSKYLLLLAELQRLLVEIQVQG